MHGQWGADLLEHRVLRAGAIMERMAAVPARGTAA